MPEERLQSKPSADSFAKVLAFMKDKLGKEGEIIKLAKADDGWECEIEVIEESAHMKKIGVKPVYEKYIYHAVLDKNFELVHYERKTRVQ